MNEKLMMCSNCDNYHCCNFRPVSSSSTVNQKLRSTRTTLMTTPLSSRQTVNQYQLGRPVNLPLEKTQLRAVSPKKVHFQRPSSTSSTNSLNGRQYLFKKQPSQILASAAKQHTMHNRMPSPSKIIHPQRQKLAYSPRVLRGSPLKSTIRQGIPKRVGNAPSRINHMRSLQQVRTVQLIPPSKTSLNYHIHKPNQIIQNSNSPHNFKAAAPVIIPKNPPTSTVPHVPITTSVPSSVQQYSPHQSLLKSSVIQINSSFSRPSLETNIFPNPSNVMIHQTIQKQQISRSPSQAFRSSQISTHQVSGYARRTNSKSRNLDCSLNDNRCFGFDFVQEAQHQLKLDESGHVKHALMS